MKIKNTYEYKIMAGDVLFLCYAALSFCILFALLVFFVNLIRKFAFGDHKIGVYNDSINYIVFDVCGDT